MNQLRESWPAHINAMDVATTNLENRGAAPPVRQWQPDQPVGLKRPQKQWTVAVHDKLADALRRGTSCRHAAAIRSGASSEASRFLQLHSRSSELVSDEVFRTSARRRLGLRPVPASVQKSDVCQNVVKKDGRKCNAALDAEGHHGATCEAGGALDRRHNAIRDKLAKSIAADLGHATHTEQRCPQWDKFDQVKFEKTGNGLVEARLDIVVPLGNTTYYVDVTVVDVLSTDAAVERQRAKRNGVAASTAEDRKLMKYPGATTVPFAIESYGRIGNKGLTWLKRAYHEKPECMQVLLNELSALVQSHTANMILASCAAPARAR